MSAVPLDVEQPALEFRVERVEAVEHAVVPTLAFHVAIDADGRAIQSISLNTQIRIDASRRAYDEGERERLYELFGREGDWSRTVRNFLWTRVSTTVPGFTGSTVVELHVPCTYDFDVVAAKYLHALGGGTVPLELLFSGSVFFPAPGGRLQVAHVPWDREARCRLPVRVWKDALEHAFPGAAWLRVRRDVFDRLQEYKAQRALLSWDRALEQLLDEAE